MFCKILINLFIKLKIKLKNFWAYIFSEQFSVERRVFRMLIFFYSSQKILLFFFCSWLRNEYTLMTCWDAVNFALFIIMCVFFRNRYKSKRKKIPQTNLIIETYVLFLSIKNKFIFKSLIASLYISLLKLYDCLFSSIRANAYFINRLIFSKFRHNLNSSNYTKINKNYRRYHDILKRYK